MPTTYRRRRRRYTRRSARRSYSNRDQLRLFDQDGNPVRVEFEPVAGGTYTDMVPPRRRATETTGDWNIVRSRGRF